MTKVGTTNDRLCTKSSWLPCKTACEWQLRRIRSAGLKAWPHRLLDHDFGVTGCTIIPRAASQAAQQ